MINKEDLKQEIEQLDVNCLELVYRLLQQFPHKKNTKSTINPLDYLSETGYLPRLKLFEALLQQVISYHAESLNRYERDKNPVQQ